MWYCCAPYISIWIRGGGKNPTIRFVRHRYSLSRHLNHIFQALSPQMESPREESRSQEIMKKELIWPSLAARKSEGERELRREMEGKVDRRSQGRSEEEVPPPRAGSWGQNSDNESPQLLALWRKTSDVLKRPKKGQQSPWAPQVFRVNGFNKDFGGEILYSVMTARTGNILASLLLKLLFQWEQQISYSMYYIRYFSLSIAELAMILWGSGECRGFFWPETVRVK